MVRLWRHPEWPRVEANVGTTRYVPDSAGEIEADERHVAALGECGFVAVDHPQAVAHRGPVNYSGPGHAQGPTQPRDRVR